ncbi:hypothetical protein [Methylocella sp.]|uniref:hypothetical protein n=1 Tax=Methylocella sp. TaxID=1978226 RepID=UPI0037851161
MRAGATQAVEEARVPAERRAAFPSVAAARPRPPHKAFLHLFHAIKALNRSDAPFVLQFLASSDGEGASVTAAGFAEAAAAHWQGSVLLIDCSATDAPTRPGPQSLIEAFSEKGALHGATQPSPDAPGVVLARLTAASGAFSSFDLSDLGRLFDAAKQAFPIVVLDCPPPAEAPESLALARCSDGTVLVVGAGASTRSRIVQTRNDVERFGGQLVGCVLNRAASRIPRWLERWL